MGKIKVFPNHSEKTSKWSKNGNFAIKSSTEMTYEDNYEIENDPVQDSENVTPEPTPDPEP